MDFFRTFGLTGQWLVLMELLRLLLLILVLLAIIYAAIKAEEGYQKVLILLLALGYAILILPMAWPFFITHLYSALQLAEVCDCR